MARSTLMVSNTVVVVNAITVTRDGFHGATLADEIRHEVTAPREIG